MNKRRYAFPLLILSLCAILQTAFAQEKLLETTFASSEEFNRWQVIDGNNDDVTWRYNPTSSRGHAGYSYHYANGADDWLISPKITVDEATQLMVRYDYWGSFYSEKLEVYFGHSPEPEEMKLMAMHDNLKDEKYSSCFFTEVAQDEAFYIAFRAASLPNKQQLFISSVEVLSLGSDVAKDYQNKAMSESGLTLATDTRYVVAGAGESVEFVVYDGDREVTEQATLHVRTPAGVSYVVDGMQYTCDAVGDYRFHATLGSQSSSDAPLVLKALYDMPKLPEDAQPESVDYLRRALLVQGTGVDCQYCPNGIEAIWNFHDTYDRADRVCHIAHHSYYVTDPLWCEAADVIKHQTSFTGYPNMTINFSKAWATSGESVKGFGYFLTNSVDAALQGESQTNIALSAQYDAERGKICVICGVKPAEVGLFRLTVVLVQDSVYAPQRGTYDQRFYIHESAVRALSPADGSGVYLNYGKHEQPGKVYQYNCEFDVADLVQQTYNLYSLDVLRHARIVAYVKRFDGVLDNVAPCKMNDSQPFAYATEGPSYPTVGVDKANFDLNSPATHVDVYNLSGVLQKSVSGANVKGLNLPRGIYILREKDGEATMVRKVFVR